MGEGEKGESGREGVGGGRDDGGVFGGDGEEDVEGLLGVIGGERGDGGGEDEGD